MKVATDFWFKAVRTEEYAKDAADRVFLKSPFAVYLAKSWSYLVDRSAKSNLINSNEFEILSFGAVPKWLFCCTSLQHIHLKYLIPTFKENFITDVFWSHAKVNQFSIDGIRIHSFPLFPSLCVDGLDGPLKLHKNYSLCANRDLLYSFVGAYVKGLYISGVREFIFNLPMSADSVIKRNDGGWHFDDIVYRQQLGGEVLPDERLHALRQRESFYRDTMLRSIFSLCPSGSGPNSIRLWESLGFGCIPVLLSDQLRLPGTDDEWEGAIVRLPETEEAVRSIPGLLKELASDKALIKSMQAKCHQLWLRYGLNGPETIFREFLRPQNLQSLLRQERS